MAVIQSLALTQSLALSRRAHSEQLGNEITELSSYIYAATYQLLVKIHEFDRDEYWRQGGMCSCAHWLNYRCGTGMNAAREKLRVANALPSLPRISASFSKGEISYSKVRAMTRVATADNEDFLLNIAHHGTAHHMERFVAQYCRAKQRHDSASANIQHQDRSFSHYYDDDGSLVIRGRIPAEQGAMIVKALRLGIDTAEREDGEETHVPIATRRADAFVEMAESYLARGARASGNADRYQVMVHVTAETLKNTGDEHAKTDPAPVTAVTLPSETNNLSHIEDGPHVTAETSRRIACDCSLTPLLTDKNDQPLNIGRKSRSIPPPMRRALQARDKGCRFPGCTHQYFIDGHHIKHWADGGETRLDNLVLLCRRHHRLVHEGGFACTRSNTGQLVFRDKRGEIIGISGTVPPLPGTVNNPKARQRIRNRLEALYIDASTCATKWDGMPMDYGYASEILWQRDYSRA
jgi:hypothetical protein